MTIDADSIDALIHAITGLSHSEEEIARHHDKIPPYLRIREAEIAEKIRVVRTLTALAAAIGPAKTKDVLVPKLDELAAAAIDGGEDELLMELCQQLGQFTKLLGPAANCVCLLGPLGRVLGHVEEVVVGEAAADALLKVIEELPAAQVEANFPALIKTLFEADDLYCSSRRAGCRLLAPCYAKVTSQELRSDLKSRLLNAANNEDEILLVREAAVGQLGLLAQHASKERPEILASLVSLSNDNHRDVRAASVESLLESAKHCADKELLASVAPVLEKFVEDSHRNTRLQLATHLAAYQTVLNRVGKSLGALFIRLWEDNEPEVRRASAKNLSTFADACPKDFFNSQLSPKLREHLVNERDERVRRENIAQTVKLLPRLRKEDAAEMVKTVLGLVAEGGTAAAKQAVFDHLKDILAISTPADMKGSVIPNLLKLYNDSNWRVRLGAVKVLPELMGPMDDAQVSGTMVPAFVSWLRDPACEIRNLAAAALGRVARERKSLAESVARSANLAALATDPNYQFRKIWINCATELMEHGPTSCVALLMPQLMKLGSDKVPNVRMAVARSLMRLAGRLDANTVKKEVQEPLAELAKDQDPDVRFYASEAAVSLHK